MGTETNCLNEMVLLSAKNMFTEIDKDIIIISPYYAQNISLLKPMLSYFTQNINNTYTLKPQKFE